VELRRFLVDIGGVGLLEGKHGLQLFFQLVGEGTAEEFGLLPLLILALDYFIKVDVVWLVLDLFLLVSTHELGAALFELLVGLGEHGRQVVRVYHFVQVIWALVPQFFVFFV